MEKSPPHATTAWNFPPWVLWGARGAEPGLSVRPASQVRDQSLSHLPKSCRQTVGEQDRKQARMHSAQRKEEGSSSGAESQFCVWEPGKEPLGCGDFPR